MNDIKRQYYRKVRENRDHSYDGRLYTAVKSTKIYCKPSCSAKQPLEKNVLYFLEQEQALKAGFRPCLKCKPQYSPYNNGQQDCISNFLRDAFEGEPKTQSSLARWRIEVVAFPFITAVAKPLKDILHQ